MCHNSNNSLWIVVRSNERDARDLTPGDGGLLLLSYPLLASLSPPVTHTPCPRHAAPI